MVYFKKSLSKALFESCFGLRGVVKVAEHPVYKFLVYIWLYCVFTPLKTLQSIKGNLESWKSFRGGEGTCLLFPPYDFTVRSYTNFLQLS